jgi:hypothetical protein
MVGRVSSKHNFSLRHLKRRGQLEEILKYVLREERCSLDQAVA